MKAPGDIRKGLEYLSITNAAEKAKMGIEGLPYAYVEDIATDALAYIRQLERYIHQLERELAESCAGKAAYDDLYEKYCSLAQLTNEKIPVLLRKSEEVKPKWISVKERLPEVGDLVLVIANGQPRPNIELRNAVLIASYWAEEGWIAEGYEEWESVLVSYWMPLPDEPWKREVQDV